MPPVLDDLTPGVTLHGPLLPEAVEVVVATRLGASVRIVGRGLQSGTFIDRVLDQSHLAVLKILSKEPSFDGDGLRFKLGVEAARLGLAYEHDPYFSLSIARIDPLPHQLEAVYDYFLKLPRIRFLLADDPGAGKTIMAGLLLKELKIRVAGDPATARGNQRSLTRWHNCCATNLRARRFFLANSVDRFLDASSWRPQSR